MYNKGQLSLQPGCNAAQTLEAKITGVLNSVRETTAKVRVMGLYHLLLFCKCFLCCV